MRDVFTEKFFKVLNILSQEQEKDLSQRDLARQTGLSLGMVNLVLKRLVKTGYIKASNLNRKKMGYILTPKGITEKMERSYGYFLRAYKTIHESKARIEAMVEPLLQKGFKKFIIVGDSEVSDLVEMTLFSKTNEKITVHRYRDQVAELSDDDIVLDCRLSQAGASIGISVLEKILHVKEEAPEKVEWCYMQN